MVLWSQAEKTTHMTRFKGRCSPLVVVPFYWRAMKQFLEWCWVCSIYANSVQVMRVFSPIYQGTIYINFMGLFFFPGMSVV